MQGWGQRCEPWIGQRVVVRIGGGGGEGYRMVRDLIRKFKCILVWDSHEVSIRDGGKIVHVVFKYLLYQEACCRRGGGGAE